MLYCKMSLLARVTKTASRTMIRQFHVEQKGIPGAVGCNCLRSDGIFTVRRNTASDTSDTSRAAVSG